MSRIIFPQGLQAQWINSLTKFKDLPTTELAKICGVHPRTFRDWRRGKYNISKDALLKLSKYFHVEVPKTIKCVSNFWYVEKGARKGGIKRFQLYGEIGTLESRKKGGTVSQQKRKENPEKYRALGCIVRKIFTPLTETESFAEITGIILGDGGITSNQLRITLDGKTDKEYAIFVKDLMEKVFNSPVAWYEYQNDNTIDLCISGVALIEQLEKWNLKKGNKIKMAVDFPSWIWKKLEYQRACVRGLVDTDGGLYFHTHLTKRIKYRNLGLCFTTWSKPLLLSVSKVLVRHNIKHSIDQEGRIYIYSIDEIKKYSQTFGPSNPKFKQKLDYYLAHTRRLN